MSTTDTAPARPAGPTPARTDKAQYAVAAGLVVAGGYVLYDASTLAPAFSDQPVQPNALPYLVGAALVLLGGLLALATRRGDLPSAEEGEDIDLTLPSDWATVAKLVGVFVLNIVLIEWLGWAITGALLFAGAAWVLGSRRIVLNLAIGVVLSVGTWYGFYVGLGVPIPAGILDGVL
jgi:putative tricarboxylic transport membrane protein